MVRRACYVLAAIGLIATLPRLASAHADTPQLVVEGAPAGPYVLGLWADPDIGSGSFMFGTGGRNMVQPTTVVLRLQPPDGRRAEVGAPATGRRIGDETVFVARVPLDAGGSWSGVVEANGPAAGHGEGALQA
jgi:hypothetical protein